MGRIALACRAFFAALAGSLTVERFQAALGQPATTAAPSDPPAAIPAAPSTRSEAVTLLAALQREARFVDLVQEPLNDYSDAQIGAAARDVLRDCQAVLDRMFALQPVMDQEDQSQVTAPPDARASRYRILGSSGQNETLQGTLIHAGWEASRCDLPTWSGDAADRNVIAPAEIEVASS